MIDPAFDSVNPSVACTGIAQASAFRSVSGLEQRRRAGVAALALGTLRAGVSTDIGFVSPISVACSLLICGPGGSLNSYAGFGMTKI